MCKHKENFGSKNEVDLYMLGSKMQPYNSSRIHAAINTMNNQVRMASWLRNQRRKRTRGGFMNSGVEFVDSIAAGGTANRTLTQP
ncbi:hypothetical protein ACFX13_010064 [Malus domestica]